MSRVPRSQEHLKTAFAAEAASAARFRAFAGHAEQEGLRELAERWLRLAESKDRMAARLLAAAGGLAAPAANLRQALSDERYENEVLYPKMIEQVEAEAAEALQAVVGEQREHVAELERLRGELQAAAGDLAAAGNR